MFGNSDHLVSITIIILHNESLLHFSKLPIYCQIKNKDTWLLLYWKVKRILDNVGQSSDGRTSSSGTFMQFTLPNWEMPLHCFYWLNSAKAYKCTLPIFIHWGVILGSPRVIHQWWSKQKMREMNKGCLEKSSRRKDHHHETHNIQSINCSLLIFWTLRMTSMNPKYSNRCIIKQKTAWIRDKIYIRTGADKVYLRLICQTWQRFAYSLLTKQEE